jgi:hypothetical protein
MPRQTAIAKSGTNKDIEKYLKKTTFAGMTWRAQKFRQKGK